MNEGARVVFGLRPPRANVIRSNAADSTIKITCQHNWVLPPVLKDKVKRCSPPPFEQVALRGTVWSMEADEQNVHTRPAIPDEKAPA